MRRSLADAAVYGSAELLEQGDIEGLLAFHRQKFGGFTMMAEKNDDPDDDSDSSEDDSSDSDDSDDDDDSEDSDESSEPTAEQKRIQELSAEGKKKRIKIRQQKERITELETENAQLKKNEGKDADDKADSNRAATSEELTQMKGDFDKILGDNEDLRIQLAFVSNKKYTWKNPKAALKIADLSDVDISDDGEVEGLDEALDALAESDPYLLDDSSTDDSDEDESTKRRKRSTGQKTRTRKRGTNPSRDKLISKYPALRR